MDNQDVDDDDDIEINVGEAYDASQLEPIQPGTPDEQDTPYHEAGRKNSVFQQPSELKKEQSFSNTTDPKSGNANGTSNNHFGGNTSNHNVMNMFDMNMQPSMDPSMMQNMMLMMQNGSGTFDANTFMNMSRSHCTSSLVYHTDACSAHEPGVFPEFDELYAVLEYEWHGGWKYERNELMVSQQHGGSRRISRHE